MCWNPKMYTNMVHVKSCGAIMVGLAAVGMSMGYQTLHRTGNMRILLVNVNTTASMTDAIAASARAVAGRGHRDSAL